MWGLVGNVSFDRLAVVGGNLIVRDSSSDLFRSCSIEFFVFDCCFDLGSVIIFWWLDRVLVLRVTVVNFKLFFWVNLVRWKEFYALGSYFSLLRDCLTYEKRIAGHFQGVFHSAEIEMGNSLFCDKLFDFWAEQILCSFCCSWRSFDQLKLFVEAVVALRIEYYKRCGGGELEVLLFKSIIIAVLKILFDLLCIVCVAIDNDGQYF